ncbi:DoxX family protein [Chryseobacterium sp. cx-311]|uniref:DoxX family protein n=1 Tax=Marnyiella aurantia TaxID=2758037 RepID=UPI001AE20C7A|nr:DoxX family protein [Marnyiella aurantia]MBP0611443.1 DoxX family protein [Marnyiella aurantia]
MFKRLIYTDHSPTTLLIRLMVGAVFLSEGLQKFLFPGVRGAGRFEKIGLPEPEFLGNLVGGLEILCGLLILLGLLTRIATVPLMIIMVVALTSTKMEILAEKGFWEMAHAARTDWAMLLGSIFLLMKGAGRWSLDKMITTEWTTKEY